MNGIAGQAKGSARVGERAGTPSPHPIIEQLPGIFHGDDLMRRFTSGLDLVWGDVFVTLANTHAYLNASTAPPDFLRWLSSWVGIALDENWPEERQRAVILGADRLYRRRGTARGLRDAVVVYTGLEPEIDDPGGVSWSLAPGERVRSVGEQVTVTLRVPASTVIDETRLAGVVAEAMPAHIRWSLEMVKAG